MHVVFTEFTQNSLGVGSNFALWYTKIAYGTSFKKEAEFRYLDIWDWSSTIVNGPENVYL